LLGLPAPVVRYFEFALTPRQPLIRRARIEHRGEFRGARDAKWSPFRSVQHFSVQRPGFVWDARVHMAPLVTVRVRDSYIGGQAGMLAKLAGLVSVVDEAGTPHLNSGALHRHFMEASWFPTALLPSQGVRWVAIDDRSARASLTDAGITVSMVVHFAPSGELVRVEADRMRDVDGMGVPTPFVGHVHGYQRIDGMMIPVEGEVEWILPEGRLNFWRGRITEATYDFAQQRWGPLKGPQQENCCGPRRRYLTAGSRAGESRGCSSPAPSPTPPPPSKSATASSTRNSATATSPPSTATSSPSTSTRPGRSGCWTGL
jgi:hypothetical protein